MKIRTFSKYGEWGRKRIQHLYQRLFHKENVPNHEYGLGENDWERSYESGKWDFLNRPEQLAHYSVIIGYITYYKHHGAVLDVGCGEGILLSRMCSCSYSRYVGIDVSETAIDKALEKKAEKCNFVKTSIQDYKCEEKFDVIVLNEVLYYLENPLQILKHCEAFLKDDGILIVSMYCSEETSELWKKIESVYAPLDETRISNRLNTSWVCKVYRSSNGQYSISAERSQ